MVRLYAFCYVVPSFLTAFNLGVEYWLTQDPASATITKQCAADGEDPTCSASVPSQGIDVAHTLVRPCLPLCILVLTTPQYFNILALTPFCS